MSIVFPQPHSPRSTTGTPHRSRTKMASSFGGSRGHLTMATGSCVHNCVSVHAYAGVHGETTICGNMCLCKYVRASVDMCKNTQMRLHLNVRVHVRAHLWHMCIVCSI